MKNHHQLIVSFAIVSLAVLSVSIFLTGCRHSDPKHGYDSHPFNPDMVQFGLTQDEVMKEMEGRSDSFFVSKRADSSVFFVAFPKINIGKFDGVLSYNLDSTGRAVQTTWSIFGTNFFTPTTSQMLKPYAASSLPSDAEVQVILDSASKYFGKDYAKMEMPEEHVAYQWNGRPHPTFLIEDSTKLMLMVMK